MMTKTLLSALVISGMLGLTAQAQTTPATPAGNHTAGTTSNPVDPTSKTGQAVSDDKRTTDMGSRKSRKTKTRGSY